MPEAQTQYKHQLQSYTFVAAHASFQLLSVSAVVLPIEESKDKFKLVEQSSTV